jgi:hypothetical protein
MLQPAPGTVAPPTVAPFRMLVVNSAPLVPFSMLSHQLTAAVPIDRLAGENKMRTDNRKLKATGEWIAGLMQPD